LGLELLGDVILQQLKTIKENMSKAPQDTLENLHSQVAQELLQRVISGEASSADMSNAIKFLKDNGIEGLAMQDSPLGNLVNILPFPSKESLKN
jgi:hypothetical protein